MDYRGEPILGDDHFLRRIPGVLDAQQRILLEGLVHVADSLAAAYYHLYETALKCGRDDGTLSARDRAMMFNCAWSIVDDLYAAGKLITRLRPGAPSKPGDFLDLASDVADLRNAMDHLAERAGNFASARNIQRPLFGAISFFYVAERDIVVEGGEERIRRARAYSISAGSVSGRGRLMLPMPQGGDIDTPLDLLLFSAFDRDVDFQPAILKFRDFINDLGAVMERSFAENSHLYKSAVIPDELFGAIVGIDLDYAYDPPEDA